MIPREQIIMGALIALLGLNGLWAEQRIVAQTKTGRFLVRLFGANGGLWALRILLMGSAIFGMFLATNVIRPMRW